MTEPLGRLIDWETEIDVAPPLGRLIDWETEIDIAPPLEKRKRDEYDENERIAKRGRFCDEDAEIERGRFFDEDDEIAVSPRTLRLIAERSEMEGRRESIREARSKFRLWRKKTDDEEEEDEEEEEDDGEAERLLERIEEEKGKAKRRQSGPAVQHRGASTAREEEEEEDARDIDPVVASAMMQPSYGLREYKREERQTFGNVLMRAPEFHARDVVLNRVKRAAPHRRPVERRELEGAFARDHDLHSRKFEDAILRTPRPDTTEKPCANGQRCQGYITFGDVLVECLTQKDYAHIGEQGDMFSRQAGRCLRCRRADVLYYYSALRAEAKPIQGGHFISDFYNFANARGEYLLDDCIVSGRGSYANLPKPVVSELASYYRREKRGQIVYHVQAGYRRPGYDPGFH